jgi:hypothetical protein
MLLSGQLFSPNHRMVGSEVLRGRNPVSIVRGDGGFPSARVLLLPDTPLMSVSLFVLTRPSPSFQTTDFLLNTEACGAAFTREPSGGDDSDDFHCL